MPSLTQTLEKRIQELRSSIESQTAEMAAYAAVLDFERSHPGGTARRNAPAATPLDGNAAALHKTRGPQTASEGAHPEFSGSKTGLVMAIVKERGRSGASPKEVDDVFTVRRIPKSKNLIYNALALFVQQGKLKRKEGRYFSVSADSNPEFARSRKRKRTAEALKKNRQAKRSRAKKSTAQDTGHRNAPKKSVPRTDKGPSKKSADQAEG